MAKVIRNIITAGLAGALGNQMVFRQLHGETIASIKQPKGTRIATTAQAAQQEAFGGAVSWAKNNSTDPIYVAASRANRRQYPGPYHAGLHDALTVPVPKTTSFYLGGVQLYGAADGFKNGAGTQVMEFDFQTLSANALALEVGLSNVKPSANVGSPDMAQVFVPINPANLTYGPSLRGDGRNVWKLDLQAEMTAKGWTLTAGKYIVLKVANVENNYGTKFALDPVNDDVPTLTTFSDALVYLEKIVKP